MSSVALIVRDLGSQKARSLSLLMDAFELSMAAVKNAVASNSPVVTKKLFDRKDPQFPSRLANLLDELSAINCEWTAVELVNGQSYEPSGKFYEITAERLRKMVAAREESIAQQRHLGEMEAGEE